MGYVEQIFKKATIRGIANYLLYQENPQAENKGYERRLD